jgi:hypothetical protein
MKRSLHLLFFSLLLSISSNAQSLGGYALGDRLVSVTAPNCFDLNPEYVTGFEDDSLWVNLTPDDTVTGYFDTGWNDMSGDELLLETGYHGSNYSVRLILSTGAFSAPHVVAIADWTEIVSIPWSYVTSTCSETIDVSQERYILPLDFDVDFGLSASDEVVGIEIVFLLTSGAPDLAGAYIIGPPCSSTFSQVDAEACNSYTSPSGNYTWTASGSYNDTITNAEGCDSILFIGLIITGGVDASASLTSGTTISANLAGATYQWLTCPGLLPIVGETDQDYTATTNGEYAVIVSDGLCTDTSECIAVSQANLESLQGAGFVSVYPNPTENVFFIEYDDAVSIKSMAILDAQGRIIMVVDPTQKTIDLGSFAAGSYMLSILSTSGQMVQLVQKL